MSYTKEQIEQLWKESAKRERDLVAEYKKTHYVPSRAITRYTLIISLWN